MLIVPIENKPDWSRPPVITVGLILINILVFIFYQGNDQDILERAVGIYSTNNLLELERPHYLDYLKDKNFSDYVQLNQLPEGQQDEQIFWPVFHDRHFDNYLANLWQANTLPADENTQTWQQARQEFQQQRNQLSSIEAGLTPADRKPWTFFTSMFLHGGVGHLLGNMAFLFLFGFTLEAALKHHTYLGMYLASGVAANLLFVALNSHSYVPLVGASGAISGLMGMYLALYRLRRIRFFYTVLFYFGELRAPAILILPLWVSKELYGHFFTESNTAYWAHIGGLLAGAGLMLFIPASRKNFEQAQELKTQESELATGLNRVQQAVAMLDHKKARAQARVLCLEHSGDIRPWRLLFDLDKLQPRQKVFHETTFNLLKQFSAKQTCYSEWQPHVEEIITEYCGMTQKAPALTGNLSLALANKYWRNGARHQAENLVKQAQEKGANPRACIQLLTEMRDYYQQRQQAKKAERSAALIRLLQESTPPAAE